jgi:hypothetical protein
MKNIVREDPYIMAFSDTFLVVGGVTAGRRSPRLALPTDKASRWGRGALIQKPMIRRSADYMGGRE